MPEGSLISGGTSAVLLVNTGTPEAPRSASVRRFLARFLSDPRVVELPQWLWLPLLYGLVLPLRSPRSAHKYRLIWLPQGSPLRVYTLQLRAALERELHSLVHRGVGGQGQGEGAASAGLRVELAFLYSPPYVAETMEALRRDGVSRLIVLPLFPQASGTTTGAVYDQVARSLRRWRALPHLHSIASYYERADYIDALRSSVADHWREFGHTEHLLVSFHGIPQRCVTRGDRYAEQCAQTASQLAASLELAASQWTLSFQSRFGAERWLTPATSELLQQLPRRGVRTLTVVCPGFAADCLETLEEINLAGRDLFLKAGGERFDYVPALNARPEHARTLARLIASSGGASR